MVVYPVIFKVLCIPGGCWGFLPSTVCFRFLLGFCVMPSKHHWMQSIWLLRDVTLQTDPNTKTFIVFPPQTTKGWNLKMDPNGKGDSFFGNPPFPSISRFQPFVFSHCSLLRLANSCSSCLLPSTEEPLSSDHVFPLKKKDIPISIFQYLLNIPSVQ